MMIKKIRKNVCGVFAAAMLAAVLPLGAGAEQAKLDVPIRIEGPDGNVYYQTVSMTDDDGVITAADALIFADKQSDELTVKGADTGYITEINGTSAGKFGGYDGWYYCVNYEAPSVGVNDYELKSGDELTVYYGGFPCQLPFADTEKLASDGVITFKSNDEEYDENWNATKVVNPVADADVTVNGEKYTTDKNGEIKLDTEKLTGDLSVQIDKKDSSGAPAVLRFAPDYTIAYAPAASDTDTQSDTASDTDSAKDTDTDKSSDSDKDTSSQTSSKSSQTTSTTTTTKTTTTTTASAATTAAASSQPAATATGDGRTYLALAVFGAAALLVVVLLLLGKKEKN